ncbi:MAG: FG-GAP repeat domain-containing protein, partial [Planctomycetota bacterium]
MDVNADGISDILSGCYSQKGHDDMVGSFWLLEGQKDGTFKKPIELKGTDGKLLQVHAKMDEKRTNLTENICTRPFAVDWNGDGKLDIISGNFKGNFFLFIGEGEGKFQPTATKLTSEDGVELKVNGVHSDPFVIDWDKDGDLDLLAVGSAGEIVWAENTAEITDEKVTGAEAQAPVLSGFKTILKAVAENGPAGSTRMHIADVNGDGKLDILVGDKFSSGGVARSDLSEDEKAAFEKAQTEYTAASTKYREIYNEYRAAFQKEVDAAEEPMSREDQNNLWKEKYSKKVNEDEALLECRAKMNELRAVIAKGKTPYVRGGRVWLYV